ncbi:MAG: replication-associated recombination protein A, partial [Candidatus Neomarinimicrobiota bacterium]|nr:replication-associated recombination protein A [Candidatus Neomarinimicrobiota bacterium]
MTTTDSLFNKNLPPLAERVRPITIANFIGQDHIIGTNKIINQMISKNKYYSMILWGPPGSGKTTLARIIAKSSESIIYEISAISSGVKDLRNIIDKAQANNDNGMSSIIFIDEIHRFSKSQQDALLHAVEEGLIILIGATTENPSFEVINPLLSRCKTLKLKPLNKDALQMILNHSIKSDIILSQKNIIVDNTVQKKLIQYCGGDARKMLNAFEIALNMSDENNSITDKIIDEALQSKTQLYDKNSDYHYDTISAFIKSIRGSDPDAAIYWMAVMLEGGEKPEFILRRLIILASEDIGNADPQALQIAVAGFQATNIIGMPESAIILSQITAYLASAPKSNAS